jgi:hypothetical protein
MGCFRKCERNKLRLAQFVPLGRAILRCSTLSKPEFHPSLLILDAKLFRQACQCLIDSGASHTFVSCKFLIKLELLSNIEWNVMEKQKVKLANGSTGYASKSMVKLPLSVKRNKGYINAFIIEMHEDYQIILGMNWLTDNLVEVNFGK